MKRYLLVIVALGCLMLAHAVDYQSYRPSQAQMQGYDANAINAQAPDYQFESTSSMTKGGYTVSFAASDVRGGVTTLGEADGPKSGSRRVHRPGDDERTDPDSPEPPSPIGDTPWWFMVLLAAAFVIVRVRKIYKAKQ